MSLNSKVVYIVHAIDTEGPLYESLSETFLRLEHLFNVRGIPHIVFYGENEVEYGNSKDEFFEIADNFRSPHLWKKDGLDYILRHKVR